MKKKWIFFSLAFCMMVIALFPKVFQNQRKNEDQTTAQSVVSWYNAFFQKLDENQVHSYRLIQIWVSPSASDHQSARWIGGDWKRHQEWIQSIADLAQEARKWTLKDHRNFQIELIVDANVLEKHRELILQWNLQYPGLFEWTDWSQYQETTNEKWSPARMHCTQGCASLCSDWLRILFLFSSDFDLNVYVDIDVLSEAYRRKDEFESSSTLGADRLIEGLSNTYWSYEEGASWNNNFLRNWKASAPLQSLLWMKTAQALQSQKHLYEYMAERSQRVALTDFQEYLQRIESLLTWAQQHPHANLNEQAQLLGGMDDGVGPGLWEEMLERGWSHPYTAVQFEKLLNYGSWKGAMTLPCYHQTLQNLRLFYSQSVANQMIMLSLLLFDLSYLTSDHHLYQPLKSEILDRAEALLEELEDLLPPEGMLLYAAFSLLPEEEFQRRFIMED